jgi:hypothetical protein
MELAAPAHAMDYSYRVYGSRSIVINAAGQIQPNEKAIFTGWWSCRATFSARKPPDGYLTPTAARCGARSIYRPLQRHTQERLSACVMLWANGALKSAPDTQIGVHNASIELADGSCTDPYSYGATGRSIHRLKHNTVAEGNRDWAAPAGQDPFSGSRPTAASRRITSL